MLHVVFAIPFAKENTLRFARAVLSLPDVQLTVLSQDPRERFPKEFLGQLRGFQQVADAMDADRLEAGARAVIKAHGSIDRLLGILEPLQEPLALVRERLRIRGMDSTSARNFRDKARMKELFAAHDIGCARHRLAGTAGEALEAARQIGYPLVVKPPAGAGAKATARCADDKELEVALAGAPPRPGREVLIEEFVQGREFSFDSVTLHGQHVFHNICCYYPTPLQVIENPWIQWCVVLPRDLAVPEFADIHRTGPRALSVLGMWTGMSHMEWFRRPDGSIAIGEVAARPPGAQFMTLMSYAHGVDMYRVFAELMVFETFTPAPRRFAVAAAYLRGQAGGREGVRIAGVRGVEALRAELGDSLVELRLPEKGATVSTSYEGDGYAIVRHPDTEFVTAAAQKIVKSLRVDVEA